MFELFLGTPTWGKLYRLASEATAKLTYRVINTVSFNKANNSSHHPHHGGIHTNRGNPNLINKCQALNHLRLYLTSELPSTILLDVLELCLSWDHFRCHHNPTECLALELWRVFYHDKLTDIHISHHAFAFPKTTNYPDIVTNVQRLLEMLRESPLDQLWVREIKKMIIKLSAICKILDF